MPRFEDRRDLPYRAEQMYDLVADVGSYQDFLPWCQGVRVYNRNDKDFYADLIIGFKMFRERFTSQVHLEDDSIEVKYIKGPLKYLVNRWEFTARDDGGCHIDFLVDFEFKNRLFEKMVGALFSEAVSHMIQAFEKRAHELYGSV
ncbi:type II toxin-antitoxin system RatA family toxin [Emcibacter nanhaiensis]|uniref:Type II toxin-antitoxin system RatA family toxin n=1 Tax=Emcibacter nanhaiensis TaxID=1505037 RepID=A0A501PTM1_9PROT|nr:type II toxin-antitoxin system RatA family toxin [Emcibacter nanhaiensis]TPD63061.1 type II toxin-antitoxin system RatA family toxin [Emcibacter nanhaiensis]